MIRRPEQVLAEQELFVKIIKLDESNHLFVLSLRRLNVTEQAHRAAQATKKRTTARGLDRAIVRSMVRVRLLAREMVARLCSCAVLPSSTKTRKTVRVPSPAVSCDAVFPRFGPSALLALQHSQDRLCGPPISRTSMRRIAPYILGYSYCRVGSFSIPRNARRVL